MDLSHIQEYLDYIPYIWNPRDILDRILQEANYLNADEKQQVIDAYIFAEKWHADVKRLSGEEYIIHPLKVLDYLMQITPDVPTMQAALLHDLIEDTDVTYEDVVDKFWEEVAELCVWLEKVSKVRYSGSGEERKLETLKKTFLAMWKDLRVIIIKLADRVHNIQTLQYHPKPEKRNRIADETLKIFVPIAKRLWLYVYQSYLENGAFAVLEPKEFQRIVTYLRKYYGNVDLYKQKWIDLLMQLCRLEGIKFDNIVWRLKSPHRIWKKLKKYHTSDIGKIMDILAFRIVADDVGACYNMLWLIHKHYTPIFSKMKDYIALPKPNGYKSLHTTVLWMFDFPVEIQVRTKEMDQIANYWVAAHYAYSDHEKSVSVSDKQAYWIQNLQNIVKKYQESSHKEWFKDELNIEILQKNIFVYTPKWDIIELPQWSSILDFAFRVHTDIWLKYKNAFINGRIVPIDYTLKTWDIVDIKTFKNKYTATRWWIKFLHTPSAKSRLNRFLRHAEKDKIFKEVSEQINKKLHTYTLPLLWTKDDVITKEYKDDAYENLMYRIRDKQLTINKLIRDAYPERSDLSTIATVWPKISFDSTKKQLNEVIEDRIIVDKDKDMEVILCPECKPKKGDRIIAKTGKEWIKIHTLSCSALKTVVYNKLLEAHWYGDDPTIYTLRIVMRAADKPGMLLNVLKIFDFFGMNLQNIHTQHGLKITEWNKDARIQVDLVVENPSKAYYLLKDLEERKKVIMIENKKIL